MKCEKCNRIFKKLGFGNHKKYCKGIRNCLYCKKNISQLRKKQKYCSNKCSASKNKNWFKKTGRPTNYKGIEKFCIICNKKLRNTNITGYCIKHYSNNLDFHTKRKNSLKGKTGGYRKGSGIGKHGWYKGFWCDSSWELAFVIYNLENNIKFQRNKDRFFYYFDNKKRIYIPDFKNEKGEYIEIKGYKTQQVQEKINQFPINKNLIMLYKEEINSYLNYVNLKYGKDFVKLYETPK